MQHQQARSNWEKAQAEELQHQQQLVAAAEYARTHQKRQRVKDAGVHSIVESSQHSVRPDTLQAPRANTQTAADVQRGSSTQQVKRRVQRIIVSTSNFQRELILDRASRVQEMQMPTTAGFAGFFEDNMARVLQVTVAQEQISSGTTIWSRQHSILQAHMGTAHLLCLCPLTSPHLQLDVSCRSAALA
jgi:hypothetical protein